MSGFSFGATSNHSNDQHLLLVVFPPDIMDLFIYIKRLRVVQDLQANLPKTFQSWRNYPPRAGLLVPITGSQTQVIPSSSHSSLGLLFLPASWSMQNQGSAGN